MTGQPTILGHRWKTWAFDWSVTSEDAQGLLVVKRTGRKYCRMGFVLTFKPVRATSIKVKKLSFPRLNQRAGHSSINALEDDRIHQRTCKDLQEFLGSMVMTSREGFVINGLRRHGFLTVNIGKAVYCHREGLKATKFGMTMGERLRQQHH